MIWKRYPVAVTLEEGGRWFASKDYIGAAVHSILFQSGEVWDRVNQWRDLPINYKPSICVKMGRAVV